MATARLLTASCTTGWGDWIHGELWLLPEGLLRVRSSLRQTFVHQNRRTVPDTPVVWDVDEDALAQICRAHKTNLWIPAKDIVSAELRDGLTTSRVSLTMTGERRVKLLWLSKDPALAPIREALERWGCLAATRM